MFNIHHYLLWFLLKWGLSKVITVFLLFPVAEEQRWTAEDWMCFIVFSCYREITTAKDVLFISIVNTFVCLFVCRQDYADTALLLLPRYRKSVAWVKEESLKSLCGSISIAGRITEDALCSLSWFHDIKKHRIDVSRGDFFTLLNISSSVASAAKNDLKQPKKEV